MPTTKPESKWTDITIRELPNHLWLASAVRISDGVTFAEQRDSRESAERLLERWAGAPLKPADQSIGDYLGGDPYRAYYASVTGDK